MRGEIELDNIRRSCERGIALAQKACSLQKSNRYYSAMLDQFEHTLNLLQELRRELER